jgi:hypothetical protein
MVVLHPAIIKKRIEGGPNLCAYLPDYFFPTMTDTKDAALSSSSSLIST